MKKVYALFICLALIISIFPTSVFAVNELNSGVVTAYTEPVESYSSNKALEEIVDIEELSKYLFNSFYQCESTIDISSYNIPYSSQNINSLQNLINNEMPECFHITYCSYAYGSGKLMQIVPNYIYSASVYHQMYAELTTAKDKLLQGIANNNQLTDVEKALLIHDRLALKCEYDFNNTDNKYDCYGALVKGIAVCQGYAEAYDYLLEQIGITSYICSSESLNHGWNIVYINNTPYHVDVTWDDQRWGSTERGVVGMVSHENFLRSSSGIYSTGHDANDYDVFPTDTTYDNYFWQNSDTAFQLIDNELYYIDNASEKLKKYDDNKELYNVSDIWIANSSSYWLGNFSRLSSDNTNLYYSLSNAIYKYDLTTQTSTKIFEPDLAAYNRIYGFECRDGYLICDINDAPPWSNDLHNLYQVKEKLPVTFIKDSTGNVMGNFTSLADALAASTEGQTIFLQADTEEADVVLPAGVSLDLSGHTITVNSVLTFSGSKIIDSSEEKTGLLKITDEDGNMISNNNCQLPVYDRENCGYRFFTIDVMAYTVTGKNTDTPKFWFKIKAEKFAHLYDLIQADAKLQIKLKISWDGQAEDTYAAADLAFVKKWADSYISNEDVYIAVTLEEIQGLTNITLTPCIEANNVEIISADPITIPGFPSIEP